MAEAGPIGALPQRCGARGEFRWESLEGEGKTNQNKSGTLSPDARKWSKMTRGWSISKLRPYAPSLARIWLLWRGTGFADSWQTFQEAYR